MEHVEEPSAEAEETEPEKTPNKSQFYMICAGAAALPVLLLVLAVCNVINLSTAVYLVGLGLVPIAVALNRETTSIWNVFLACALAALLTAVYCLWIEIGRYHFDFGAKEAKQLMGTAMMIPIEPRHGPAPVERDWV